MREKQPYSVLLHWSCFLRTFQRTFFCAVALPKYPTPPCSCILNPYPLSPPFLAQLVPGIIPYRGCLSGGNGPCACLGALCHNILWASPPHPSSCLWACPALRSTFWGHFLILQSLFRGLCSCPAVPISECALHCSLYQGACPSAAAHVGECEPMPQLVLVGVLAHFLVWHTSV